MAAEITQSRKAVSAAVMGNILEWYDFAAYAFVASIIARKFFPSTDEVTSLIATFLVMWYAGFSLAMLFVIAYLKGRAE